MSERRAPSLSSSRRSSDGGQSSTVSFYERSAARREESRSTGSRELQTRTGPDSGLQRELIELTQQVTLMREEARIMAHREKGEREALRKAVSSLQEKVADLEGKLEVNPSRELERHERIPLPVLVSCSVLSLCNESICEL